jgi:DNA-dependent RNA polymerase auxiliary subunit epsilon
LDGKEKSKPQQKGTQSGNIEVKLMSPVFKLLDRKKYKINFKNILTDSINEKLECCV